MDKDHVVWIQYALKDESKGPLIFERGGRGGEEGDIAKVWGKGKE